MTGYLVEISTAHVFVIMGSVISRRAQFAFAFDIEPSVRLPLLSGFALSLFASWHGYETLMVSLVTHRSDGNIEL